MKDDTLHELADELDAIALWFERRAGHQMHTGALRDIADKLRERARLPHAELGQPDEAQAPYIAEPVCEKYGEQMDD